MVVEVAGSRQGFAKLLREGEVLQGEREAPGAVVLPPSLPPTIYRPPGRGGGASLEPIYMGGGKGGGGVASPQAKWGAPTPRVSNPRRRGRPMGGAPAH